MNDWGELAELEILSIAKANTNFKFPTLDNDFKKVDTERTNALQECLKNNMPSDDQEDEEDLTVAELSHLKDLLISRFLDTTFDFKAERQKDTSPLHSLKSFAELPIPPNLLRGIYAMNYDSPSKIQEIALPMLLANPPVNMIAQAQSGTGKTAAFLVASIARVDIQENHPQVLILAPTFELAVQIGDVARKMATFCPSLNCRYAVRGEEIPRGLSVSEHIIIGTPGKVFDWSRRTKSFDITKIKVFVLDEADVMISTQGHQDQCIRIHKMLSKDRHKCQMLLFSATYPQEVMDFAEQIVPDPIIIRVPRQEQTLDYIRQYFIRCACPDVKYEAIKNIYGSISVGQAIIFCRTKRTACWLGQNLSEDGHSVGYLSSDLNVQQRFEVIGSFRAGKEKVLITTNVVARGIDIEQITMVINYDLPITVKGEADCETYLHRIGRTGRFGKTGLAINFVCCERDERILKTIESYFGKPIRKIDAEDVDDLEAM